MASRHQLVQRKTQATNFGLALASLALAYLFFSLSVDRGNLFYYLLTLIFLVFFLKFGVSIIKGLLNAIFH